MHSTLAKASHYVELCQTQNVVNCTGLMKMFSTEPFFKAQVTQHIFLILVDHKTSHKLSMLDLKVVNAYVTLRYL